MASPLSSFRVGVGGIVHETNTYAVETFGLTGLDAFAQVVGQDIVRVHRALRLIKLAIESRRCCTRTIGPCAWQRIEDRPIRAVRN